MSNGIWSIRQLQLPEPEQPQRIRFGRNRVEVYRGREFVGQLQPHSHQLVYKFALDALSRRIDRVELLVGQTDSRSPEQEA